MGPLLLLLGAAGTYISLIFLISCSRRTGVSSYDVRAWLNLCSGLNRRVTCVGRLVRQGVVSKILGERAGALVASLLLFSTYISPIVSALSAPASQWSTAGDRALGACGVGRATSSFYVIYWRLCWGCIC
jgi:hypothetical protein